MTADEQFSAAVAIVLKDEGGFTNDPADSGNWTGGANGVGVLKGTKFGISAASFPDLDIESLTLEEAADIYRTKYWLPAKCDQLPWPVSLVVFDAEVQSGGEGAMALQKALGVTQDGDIGPMTLAAVAGRDPVDLALRTCVNRDAFYHALSNFSTFGAGWIMRLFNNIYAAGRAAA